jgi:hypothetical protein
MKSLTPTKVLSALALLVAAVIGINVFRSHPRSARRTPAPDHVTTSPRPNSFSENQTRTIRFHADFDALQGMDSIDIEDQLRDWLLYAVVSESGMDATSTGKVLYDVPPSRAQYLKPVGAFEFGDTRFRVIDAAGTVVALIPADAPNRNVLIERIADSAQTALGRPPASIRVFEYDLNPNEFTATLRRSGDLSSDRLSSSEFGFVSGTVRSKEQFERIVAQISDLTSLSVGTNGEIEISGRTGRSDLEERIGLEDIAALWQAENRIASGLDPVVGSGFSLDPVFDYRKLDAVFARLRPKLRPWAPESELERIEGRILQRDEKPLLELLYRIEQKTPEDRREDFATQVDQAKFQRARYNGQLSGSEVGMVLFYTDLTAKLWAMDYANGAPEHQIRGFVPLLKTPLSPIYDLEMRELASTRLWFGPRSSGYAKTEGRLLLAPIATRVYAASSNDLQPGKEAQANAESAAFLGWWNDHYAQVAAYEPQYERLNRIFKWSIAFSWLSGSGHLNTLDFLGAVPVRRDNWFPEWARRKRDLRFSSWDGIEFFQKGYQGGETESMPLLRSDEYRTYFSDAGGKGYTSRRISGGVSLASTRDVAAKTPVDPKIDPSLRRPDAKLSGSAITNSDNTKFELAARDSQQVRIDATTDKPLRGPSVELRGNKISTDFRRADGAMRADAKIGGSPVGSLTIRNGDRPDTVDVLFQSVETAVAQGYGRTLNDAVSRGENPEIAFARRADIGAVIKDGDAYYIADAKDRSRWTAFTPEGPENARVAGSADLRIGSDDGRSNNSNARWNVSFVDRREVEKKISGSGRYLIADQVASARSGVAFSVQTRGPPPSGPSVVFDFGNKGGPLAAIENYQRGGGNRGGGGNGRTSYAGFGDDPGDWNEADSWLHQGNFEDARRAFDVLLGIYPEDPRTNFRRNLSHAASGSPVTAVEASRTTVHPDHLPEFLAAADAVNAHLQRESVAARQVSSLMRYFVAKAYGADVHFTGTHENLGVEIRISQAVGRSDAGRAPPGAVIFIQTPDLSSPLPHVPQADSSQSGQRVTQLQNSITAFAEPDVIRITETGKTYLRIDSSLAKVGRETSAPDSSRIKGAADRAQTAGKPRGGPQGGGPSNGAPPPESRYFQTRYRPGLIDECAALSESERRKRPECRDPYVYLVDLPPSGSVRVAR